MVDKIYEEIYDQIKDGTITEAKKELLEKYAAALCKPGANNSFGSSFHAICGTIRTLIILRMSEESNKQATRISKIALSVAVFALLVGVIQAIAAIWPLCHTESHQQSFQSSSHDKTGTNK